MELEEILSRREAVDFEVKSAQGRHGQGALPQSLWETYSAMANTEGGYILLGAAERHDGSLETLGIEKPRRVRKELWNGLNNPQVVSRNVLRDADVEAPQSADGTLLLIRIPRASRQERPVYTGENPLTGTFRRNFDGDYRCDDATVRRMLAEAVEDQRDDKLLEGFGLDDIDRDSLRAYRNAFQSSRPDHPWLTLNDRDLLHRLGGWTKNRQTGRGGLTLAGVLMFGALRSILDAVPSYVVDYRERPDRPATAEQRWTDRVTTDGTWSGNLYDFYRRVYPKLTADLKVPFRLEGARRVDATPVHEALREALVNALIHADYSGRIAVLVIKQPSRFVFRNPGGLRIPLEQVFEGGKSDCRNRNLQKMFQLAGAGEQAGSGFPKIIRAWGQEHWRKPLLRESFQPETTALQLSMTSLVPQEALAELERLFGERFRNLRETERLALTTALLEGQVTNQRLQEITEVHPSDLTELLKRLVRKDFLVSKGTGRGSYYLLSKETDYTPASDLSLFGQDTQIESSSSDSEHYATSPEHSEGNEEGSSEHYAISSKHWATLQVTASPVRETGRASRDLVVETILKLTHDRFLTLRQLSKLLGRTKDTLRNHYLRDMVEEGFLERRHPEAPSHPSQAYRAS